MASFVSFPTLWWSYSNRPALLSVYRLTANTQPSSRSANNLIQAHFTRNCNEISRFIKIRQKQRKLYMNSYMHGGKNRLICHSMRKKKEKKNFGRVWTALESVWSALQCVWSALESVWSALQCVWTALESVWSALQCVWSALESVWSALQCVWSALERV